MSNNSQWNSFRASVLNNENSILSCKPLPQSGRIPPQVPSFSPHSSVQNYGSGFASCTSPSPSSSSSSTSKFSSNVGFQNSAHDDGYSKLSCDTFSPDRSFTDNFPPIGVFSTDLYTNNSKSSTPNNEKELRGYTPSTNSISFTDHSSSHMIRETGIIEKLLHSYGFIQCCERQARLFFHFSQFTGNIEHLKIGDPVEFEMTYDRRTGKPIASMVTKIAPDVVLSEERVTGTVTADTDSKNFTGDVQARITYENRGECYFLPFNKEDVEGNVTLRIGDQVSFQMATNPKGTLSATHIRLENTTHPVKYQGVVCSLNEKSGFIERADVVKEIFFFVQDVKSPIPLTLGDDVEFNIQTKNGKEFACNIEKLPDGTVIFEDISDEIVKGQVLKTYEKSSIDDDEEPIPGKIKYRAPDHSEVEVSFGEKDQKGEFTLRHGDWVEFQIATDRRDQMKRATCISLLEDSFLVSGERREQGIVLNVTDKTGYIRPCERNVDVIFKVSEVLDVTRKIGSGDEIEFTVVAESTGTYGTHRLYAIRIKHLNPGTVTFEKLIEGGVVGIVTRLPSDVGTASVMENRNRKVSTEEEYPLEFGLISFQLSGMSCAAVFTKDDCESLKHLRVDTKVKFDLCQIKSTKQFVARNVERMITHSIMTNGRREHYYNIRKEREMRRSDSKQLHQGYISTLKEGFGFIETINFGKELFFHFSHFIGDPNTLQIGNEVEYTISTRNTSGNNSQSAENVRLLPTRTISPKGVVDEKQPVLKGVVKRPMRIFNPEQDEYAGLIQETTAGKGDRQAYEFGIVSLKDKREVLQKGDTVLFQVDSCNRAANVVGTKSKLSSTVEAIKGQFGFLTYQVDDSRKKLFFHMSQVRNCSSLRVGDTVEFVLFNNPKTGRYSAYDVVKIRDGHDRPEHLINRMRHSMEAAAPSVMVMRQPKGPSISDNGFAPEYRKLRRQKRQY